jgi:hypothetical protein
MGVTRRDSEQALGDVRIGEPVAREVHESVGHGRLAAREDGLRGIRVFDGKPDPERRRTAVLVCHGMGQQVPFDTLSLVADGVAREAGVRSSTVRFAKLGDSWLPRSELLLSAGAHECEVHFYEAYWAPLAEGKVRAWDVTRFLWDAGLRGLASTRRRSFTRRIFDGRRDFPLGWRTFVALRLTILFVAAALLGYGAVLGLAVAWVGGILELWPAPDFGIPGWQYALLIGVLTYAVLRLRRLYIQYIGDVAAYVSSHRVNRFHEFRGAVKRVAHDAACAIYGALREDGGDFEYDRVMVMGHSLGSVVAYDTLNGMINHDMVRGGPLRVVERTPLLLTFGSPLDKTAFIFRTQIEGEAAGREALATAVQPLICYPDTRRESGGVHWTNVWSPADPISGALHFYDPPESDPWPAGHRPIENVVDPDCRVPVAAHTHYWRNRTVMRHLHGALTQVTPASSPAPETSSSRRTPESRV